MSFLGIHILTDAQYQTFQKAMADAGHAVETFALSEADKAIVAAKQTSLGTTAANIISAMENKSLTGPQKFEEAAVAFIPEVLHYLTGGGVTALEADVVDFGRALLQSVFVDFKSTSAGKVATDILHVVGL